MAIHGAIKQTWYYKPKRFFCSHTDDQIQRVAMEFFELLRFKRITLEGKEEDFHF